MNLQIELPKETAEKLLAAAARLRLTPEQFTSMSVEEKLAQLDKDSAPEQTPAENAEGKFLLMQAAAQDELFLTDLCATMEDYAHVDREGRF